MKKDGVYIHVLKNASLLHDINGQVMGAVETMTDITELMEKDTQIEAFRRELQTENGFHGILGASASMQQVFDLISNASYSDAPVVIFGESGTGKELVAKAIHDTGTRRKMPFLKANRADMQKKQLIEALESADGNQSQAAEILGISRVTVWNRMKRYGIMAQRRIDR